MLGLWFPLALLAPQESMREIALPLHDRTDEHVDQFDLLGWLRLKPSQAFLHAFLQGEELFEAEFSLLDGGGANVGDGSRYTRVPRADLTGPGQWARHIPPRTTGPNARSCTACHETPANDGSGGIEDNVFSDPERRGVAGLLQRNTPHLFGAGALQALAEEMTGELHAQRDAAAARAASEKKPVTVALATHGVSFGELTVHPISAPSAPSTPAGDGARFDTSAVRGIAPDLVVRAFDWKGNTATLREFTRRALHEELGVQPTELVGEGVDGDFDGLADELNVGDVTALVLYVAGQPRPTTRRELAALELIEPLSERELEYTALGERLFARIGCADCHVPELVLADTLFREPSPNPAFRDARFPSGMEPRAFGVDVERPIVFDLIEDLTDNLILDEAGEIRADLGNFEEASGGGARIALYGDLKRHDLGAELAEAVDPAGSGKSWFLTENLWGVGSTAPYLHDGRATTLTEAILWHGGEAARSRELFLKLERKEQDHVITFLEDLVLFKLQEEPDGPGRELVLRPRGP